MSCLPAVISCVSCFAADNSSTPPFVSPYYYGPNAFPIPDILSETSEYLKIGLAVDYYRGKRNQTADVMVKANIPLWTKRANLSLWWQLHEWYKLEDASGSQSGDIYVSTDIQLFEESLKRPAWTIRAALKTASGGGYDIGRFYDCPGYFFDTYFAKTIKLGYSYLKFCGGGGFLCWQTDNGEQNDAVMYGIMADWRYKRFAIREAFGGYAGWQSSKSAYVHDRPMSLKTKLSYQLKEFEFSFMLQHGLKDWPYTQYQLCVTYSLDILNRYKNNGSN